MTILNVRDANTGKFLVVDLTNPSGTLYVNDENTGGIIPIVLGASTPFNDTLKAWTASGAYQKTSITYNATYPTVMDSATVVWPDGSSGTLTITAFNSTYLIETAYTITHTVSGKTVTQEAVTLNTNGYITNAPELVVS